MNNQINMNTKNYRHGDIGLIGIEKLPEGLKESKTKIILKSGSGGNAHSISQGKLYLKTDGFTLGYLEAKNTKLLHKEHGEKKSGELMESKIQDGTYKIIQQHQETHQSMVAVLD
jgi:hypothetical protein